MLAHPLQDAFGDGKFVPLGSQLRQLLGQLFFEFVQFRTHPAAEKATWIGQRVPSASTSERR
ncbi:hypothetical protein [Streptomyces adustus]